MKKTPIVLPVQNVEETLQNRQKAILEFAWAFYRKNPYVQYDIFNMARVGRRYCGARTCARMNNTPEMAGPQQNIFQHCNFYAYACAYHAFDHEMNGKWENCYVTPLATRGEHAEPFTVWQRTNTGVEAEDAAAMEEFFSVLQPGDIICYVRNRTVTPHVVIWLGDINGDGVGDMINVDGTPYKLAEKKDPREKNGAVVINTDRWVCESGVNYFRVPKFFDYFPLLKHISVLRYADMKHAEELPLTERAKTRLLFPGLDIYYEVEGGIYGSVVKGEELTYTLKITNRSEKEHTGILVQLPVPENAEVVKIDGNPAENDTVKWTLTIPAGETVLHTYTVKPTGEIGSVIRTGTGYVHAIPLFEHFTSVISAKTDAVRVKAALQAAAGKEGQDFLDTYCKAMGISTVIPEADKILQTLYTPTVLEEVDMFVPTAAEHLSAEGAALAKLQIPYYFGGRYIATECESLRVKELKAEHLQAGDLLLWWEDEDDALPAVAVHDGENLIHRGEAVTQEILDALLMSRFFIGLRPSQSV